MACKSVRCRKAWRMPSRPMWCARQRACIRGKCQQKKRCILSTRSPAAIAKIRRSPTSSARSLRGSRPWPKASRLGSPSSPQIRNAQARQRSSFTISHEFTYVISWRCSAHQSSSRARNGRENATAMPTKRGRASIGENLRRAERQNMRRLAVPEGVLPEEMSSEGDDSQTPILRQDYAPFEPCEPR